MSHAERVRSFVALPIDAAARRRLAESVEPLKRRLKGVRWTASESYHLTLRFLGDADPAALDALTEPLARAAGRCPACRARIAGLGTFPGRGAPRVLWADLALPEPALRLQAECERAARAAGFEPERRPFRSHLTLGRWRGRAARPDLPELSLGDAQLDRVVLFASELRASGAVHTPISAFALAGAM